MTKEERCRKALACHASTLNCAQSVLCAFSERIGWTDEQCAHVQSAYMLFCDAAKRLTLPDGVTEADAFLAWLSAHTIDDLKTLTEEQK